MSEQELQEFRRAMQRVREAHATPEKARELLKSEGVLNAAGELSVALRRNVDPKFPAGCSCVQ